MEKGKILVRIRGVALLVLIFVMVSLGEGQTAFSGECPEGPFRAYVFTGDVSDPIGYTQKAAKNSANEAQSDFEDAGYTVVRNDNATTQNVIDALNDPCARAIWIFGHGKYDSVTGKSGKEKLTDPIEGIDLADSFITGDAVTGGTLVPANEQLNQVTFHSCGQDLQSWKNKFPGANYESWGSTTRAWQIYWWQWFATYSEIDPDTGGERSTQPPPIPALHPSLEQLGQFLFEEDIEKFLCDTGSPANSCLLGDPIAEEFGDQTFNFFASDEDRSDRLLLFGASVEDGCINPSSISIDPIESTTFDVTMTNDAIFRTLENPNEFFTVLSEGKTDIELNVPGVPSNILVEGFRQVLFGSPDESPSGRTNVTSRVVLDHRCDGFFQQGLDITLDGVPVTLSFPNGTSVTRTTMPFGLVNFSGFDPSDGVTVSVILPESYRGYLLGSCPNSPANIQLQPEDFGPFRFKFVQFGAKVTGERAGP